MNLRVARKLWYRIGGPDERRYSKAQLRKAAAVMDRSREQRESRAYWHWLMNVLGPLGRAEVLAGTGAPGMALDLLMRTPESEWKYGKEPAP